MNTLKRKIAEFRERLADSICHIGWGFMGQECNCDKVWPNLNWLARRTDKWVNDWSDELDAPRTRKGRVLLAIGNFFYGLGCKLINGKLMTEYYDVLAAECPLVVEEPEVEDKERKRWNSLRKQDRIDLWHRYCKGEKVADLAVEYDVSEATAYRYIAAENRETLDAIDRFEDLMKEVA